MNCLEPVYMRIYFAQKYQQNIFQWFETITLLIPLQCFFFISVYQSMKFTNLYDGDY